MQFRRSLAALVVAAIGSWAAAGPVRAQTPPAAVPNPVVPAVVRTLPNGLRIVVLPDHAAPVAEVSTWYRFGAAQETPHKTGLAHALEHMMFRGTTALSSAGLDDWGARLGAHVNAQTTNDTTHYFFVVPADRVEAALRVEADRMHGLKLNAADWNKERGAVLQEWAQDYSNPIFAFLFGINEKAWPNSPYGRTALGAKADIERATVADLRAYYDAWYAPNNATVVVTGDVDPARVIAAATKWFGPIARAALPPHTFMAPVAGRGATVATKAEFPFTLVDLAFAAPGVGAPTERASLEAIVATIALSNQRGPLRKALVDSGLTLATLLLPIPERHVMTIHALAIVAPGHTADEVRPVVQKTLADAIAAGITPEHVAAAKRALTAQLTYAGDSITGLGDTIGQGYVFPGDLDPRTAAAVIAAVSQGDVDAAARTIFTTPAVIGVLEPTTTDPSKAKPPSAFSGAVKDSFGDRVPNGPLVQPAWLKADLARPLDLHSRVAPIVSTLPNGLKLYVQRLPDNPTVFVSGRTRTSPMFDPAGKEGLGDLTSALLGYGSAKYDFGAQRKVGDDLGAQLAYGTSFFAHGFARDLPALLDPLADSLAHPAFPSERFNLVRTQAIGVATRRALQPEYRSNRAFLEALYPAGDPILREDSAASLNAITEDDVKSFATQYIRPDTTVLVVVGDVDPATVRTQVEAAFGNWTASGPSPEAHVSPIPLPSPVRKIVETSANDVAVELGAPAIAIGNPDADALRVANAIFGGGSFESRLFREVREKRGLVYFASSNLNMDRERGTLTISFRAVPAKVDAADALIRSELRRMQTERVSADELARAKSRAIGSAVIAEQSTGTIVTDIATLGRLDLPPDYYATIAQRLRAVSAADVQRVARTYFHPDNLVEVRTGPAK